MLESARCYVDLREHDSFRVSLNQAAWRIAGISGLLTSETIEIRALEHQIIDLSYVRDQVELIADLAETMLADVKSLEPLPGEGQ